MKTKHILTLLTLIPLVVICAAPDQVRPGKAKPVKIKIATIEALKLSQAGVTGKITVEATGQVPTGGWLEPELVKTTNAPADGKTHLDFVAKKPGGAATQVITNLDAKLTLQAAAEKHIVVVHGAGNQKEASITVTIGDPP